MIECWCLELRLLVLYSGPPLLFPPPSSLRHLTFHPFHCAPPPLRPEPLHRAPPPSLLPEPLHRAPPPSLLPEPLHRAPPPSLLSEPLHHAPPPSLLSEPLNRAPPLMDCTLPHLAQSIALLCCDTHELPPPLLVRQYSRSPSSAGMDGLNA